MFNKLSIKSLGIIFGILLAVVAAFMIYDSNHGDRSFRKELVSVDTSKVTAIYLYPRSVNHHEVKLFKSGNTWNVKLNDGRSAAVPENKIQSLLSALVQIKPAGVTSSDKESWKNYQVDSTGTKVNVYQGNDKVADLIIGKFTFERPNTMLSYIRVNGDNNVYITNGFLDFTFNHKANYFRDDHIVNGNYNDWDKLTFTYPSDSSFIMLKKNNKWEINGKPADSSAAVEYLRGLDQKTNSDFIDNPEESLLSKASFTLTIEGKNTVPIIISAYENPSQTIIHSSQNPKSYFDGSKNNSLHSIFISSKHFFPKKKLKR